MTAFFNCEWCGNQHDVGTARHDCGNTHPRNTPDTQALIASIRTGDKVTILTPAGIGREGIEWKERTGKAVMRSSHGGWVLNMGGQHGTPAVADASNVVKVVRK